MNDRELTSGKPVPEDASHKENRGDGQQKDYIVLTAQERARGFINPVRTAYTHSTCGRTTIMGRSLSETYARDPWFYSGTFCATCRAHYPLNEFTWEPDGESLDSLLWPEHVMQRVQTAKKALKS